VVRDLVAARGRCHRHASVVQDDIASRFGLVIVDEEQRFGDAQGKFKQLRAGGRAQLSGRRFPHALFALTGARDMSTIETRADRLPVERS